MKKSKFTLEELSIKSFVTSISSREVKGGSVSVQPNFISIIDTSSVSSDNAINNQAN